MHLFQPGPGALHGPKRSGSRFRPALRTSTLVASALIFASAPCWSQTLDNKLWVTNGTVYATARQGDVVYVGGQFSRFGPPTGSGVVLNATTGEAIPPILSIVGTVNAALPDGAGGWFIGGTFTRVGGVSVRNLAHLLAGGSVAPWAPRPDGAVTALVLVGNVVYVGGDFSHVDGQSRARLAAMDAVTGAVTAWDPGADGGILVLTADASTIYAGGYFDHIGGHTRASIAAIDAVTGAVTAWDPNTSAYSVWTIRVSGDTVYVGGSFTSAGGQARNNLAALDRVTAAALPWAPTVDFEVTALCVSAGTVYLGGNFQTVGGVARPYLAAVDAVTGALAPWNPRADYTVRALAVDKDVVYVAGSFKSVGEAPRPGLAAVDAGMGAVLGWDARANGAARCVSVSADRVFAGGLFTSVGSLERTGLAAFDLSSHTPTNWNPGPRTNVSFESPTIASLVVAGSIVYAGGRFDTIGAEPRRNLAALDAVSGAPILWNPEPDGYVDVLALEDNTLFAAGLFQNIGGQARRGLAALDVVSASARPWAPEPNDRVVALAPAGTRVFAAGRFTTIGGQARTGIAALDPTTGLATAWDAGSNDYVSAIAVSGDELHAGGDFTMIGGKTRAHLAELSVTTALAADWTCDASHRVTHLARVGQTLYVGGVFSQLGGEQRLFLGSADASTGEVSGWAPALLYIYGGDPVQSLSAGGGSVLVGGYFAGVDSLPQSYLAGFGTDSSTPVLLSLVEASADPGHVRLMWYAGRGGVLATLYRRGPGTTWSALERLESDGTGRIVYEDLEVSPGARYGYRLGMLDFGREQFRGETWVDVPQAPQFTLMGIRRNPASDLTVTFSLPDASPARLEAFDLAGRRVFSRHVGALGSGTHTVRLDDEAPPPGVYVLRLTRGGQTLTSRAVITR